MARASVRAGIVVCGAPIIETCVLAIFQIQKRAVGEAARLSNVTVQPFVLALRLRMIGAPVHNLDAQPHQPKCQTGVVPLPDRTIVHQHSLWQPVSTQRRPSKCRLTCGSAPHGRLSAPPGSVSDRPTRSADEPPQTVHNLEVPLEIHLPQLVRLFHLEPLQRPMLLAFVRRDHVMAARWLYVLGPTGQNPFRSGSTSRGSCARPKPGCACRSLSTACSVLGLHCRGCAAVGDYGHTAPGLSQFLVSLSHL